MRRNLQAISLLLSTLLVIVSAANQSPQLANACALYAASQNRYGVQYANDVTSQRCSFCQYTQTGSTFYGGCTICPSYTTGQCNQCQNTYVATSQQICIPCPEGSTCCTGNDAAKDPNYQAFTQSKTNAVAALQQSYLGLVQYTGTRQMTCQTGFFQLGHVCAAIPSGCASVEIQTTSYYCKECIPGYYLNADNVCINQCSAFYNTLNTAQASYQSCGSCLSANRCLTCAALGNSYFYLEPLPSTTENTTDPAGRTAQTIQVCSECPANCIDCSNGSDSCKTCAKNYFVDGKTCTQCNLPTAYVQLNAAATIDLYYTGCNSVAASANSYIFATSIPQIDSLSQPAPRPIVTLSNGKVTACDVGCTKCTATQTATTVCSACMNGYFLDQSGAVPVCAQCPNNSILCTYNTTLKQAQVLACAINTKDMSPPYSQTYYLQYDISIFVGDNAQKYIPNNQCVKNIQNCRQMVSDDLTKGALCSSCYSAPSDFAIGLTNSARSTYVLTTGQTCRACVGTGFSTCIQDPVNPTEIIVNTCGAGYQPKPIANACKACDPTCLTCDDNGKCLTCNTSLYFTVVDANNVVQSCQLAYTNMPSLIEGCSNWDRGTAMIEYPNCIQCQPNYTLVTKATINVSKGTTAQANLCMKCPQGCTTCGTNNNRPFCLTCQAGTYLSNGACLSLPVGCATFDGTKCTYCSYGYRLINDQWCSSCSSATEDFSFSNGQWFDCPGAQCASGSSDEPTSSFSSFLSISFVSLLVAALLI